MPAGGDDLDVLRGAAERGRDSNAEDDGPMRVFALVTGRTAFVPPQPDGWASLVWARTGAVVVRTESRAAFATGTTAIWLPAGRRYGVDMRDRCDLRIAYVARRVAPERAAGAVTAGGVLREIVERAVVCGYLDPRAERDARLLAVFVDEIALLRAVAEPLALTFPRDRRLRAAVDAAFAAPDERRAIAALAGDAGFSVRTFERRFAAETGLTPRAWLRRARIRDAAVSLACGASIADAALHCGYASLSAFVAAYREVTGATPGRSVARV